MRKFSAALAEFVMDSAKALFTPSRGRHSARRRRSTRVRRYARTLPTAQATAQANTPPERPSTPSPRPRPAPPHPHTEDIALVRPYYRAHEQELHHVQQRAHARLHAWTTKTLNPPPDDEPIFTPIRPLPTPRVPEPRVPSPRIPTKLHQLPHLARIRQNQQHRLAGTNTGQVAR